MNDPTNPTHFGDSADGWRIEGLQVLEGLDDGELITCAHCNKTIAEAEYL